MITLVYIHHYLQHCRSQGHLHSHKTILHIYCVKFGTNNSLSVMSGCEIRTQNPSWEHLLLPLSSSETHCVLFSTISSLRLGMQFVIFFHSVIPTINSHIRQQGHCLRQTTISLLRKYFSSDNYWDHGNERWDITE